MVHHVDYGRTLTSEPRTTIEPFLNGIKNVTNHEYYETYPTVIDWFKMNINNPQQRMKHYFLSYIPFVNWIYRYNFVWFWGDLIAGLTVGAIVIPQSMAYAGLAKLPPQFGLYSSFVGVMIYWFLATSKVMEKSLATDFRR